MKESALTRVMQAMSGPTSWLLAIAILVLPPLLIVGCFLLSIWCEPGVPPH